VQHAKTSHAKMGPFGVDFTILALEELRMLMAVTSENPLIVIDNFISDLRLL
jgi:hypothetical protein